MAFQHRRGISDTAEDFRGTPQALHKVDMIVPVEVKLPEYAGDKILQSFHSSSTDHLVLQTVGAKDQLHGVDIFFGPAPVSRYRQIS